MTDLTSGHEADIVEPGPPLAGTADSMFWTYASLGVSAVATAVLAAYALRTFGASIYGLFALSVTVARLAQIIPSAFITATTRVVAREYSSSTGPIPSDEAKSEVAIAHWAGLASGGIALILSALIAGGLAELGGVQASNALLLFLIGVSVSIWMSTAVLQGVATGLRSFRLLAIGTFFGAVAQLVVVLVLAKPLKAVALGLGELVAVAANRTIIAVGLRAGLWWRVWSVAARRRASPKTLFDFSRPLWIISTATQVVASTDVIILSLLSTTSVVGLYRVGSLLPTQFISSLFRGYDTAFPILAGEPNHRSQEEAVRLLTLVFSLIAGVGCGLLAFERHYLSRLMTGHSDQFVANVLLLFSVIWLVNVPVHGLALLLIARANQHRLVPLVTIEMIANLLLTVILVHSSGPLGAAWASLITILISNAVALPYVVRRELHTPVSNLLIRAGYLPAISGFGAAGLAYLVSAGVRVEMPEPIGAVVLSLAFGASLALIMVGSSDRRLLLSALRSLG